MKQMTVTNEERELVMEISDGRPDVAYKIGWIGIICLDANRLDYMSSLRWLKKENLKGCNFISWMNQKQGGSLLGVLTHARKQIHRDFKVRKIFAVPS